MTDNRNAFADTENLLSAWISGATGPGFNIGAASCLKVWLGF